MSRINATQNPWEEIPLRFVCKLNPSISFEDLNEDEDLTFLPMEKVKSGYFAEKDSKWEGANKVIGVCRRLGYSCDGSPSIFDE